MTANEDSKRQANIAELRARYSTAGNAIIPNTFQHPNMFVDKLMRLLTPTENVVLTFAVRRILGFQDHIVNRKDHISLSQFTDGITAEDGRLLCGGCGLGTDTVIQALEVLEKFRILIPTGKADARKGQEFWLQEKEYAIDWDGLETRLSDRVEKGRQQTAKSRSKIEQERANEKEKSEHSVEPTPDDHSVEPTPEHSVEPTPSTRLNRGTKLTETHENPLSCESAENLQVQEQILAGRKTMDGLLASMQPPPGVAHYPYRDKIPEQYRPWADLYVELTGNQPLKCDFSDWFETFQEWIDRGLSQQNIRDAWIRSKEKDHGFLVAKPRSLTNTANAFKAKEHASISKPRSTLDRIRAELGGQSG